MTTLSAFESSSSIAAGIYRQNIFYIRMSSLFDLDPCEGSPLPLAVAMHAHEYVHFLHNASTTAGQVYLLTNLGLLRFLAKGCDEQGHFLGLDGMVEEDRNNLLDMARSMRVQLGTTTAKQLVDCKDISYWEYSPLKVLENDGAPVVNATFSARDINGCPVSQNVEIGLSFVTEGIAYEVEREMRRLNGTPENELDDPQRTNIFPYLAYREAVRSWSGRELKTHDLIRIGVSALAHQFSGYWLKQICDALRGTDKSLGSVLEKAYISCDDGPSRTRDVFRKYCEGLSAEFLIAMYEYIKIAEAGVQLRKKSFYPELSFISKPLSSEEFKKCMGTMLDCLVMQEKPSGEAVDMYWIGPGEIAKTDEIGSRLGAFQAGLHFSQLHLIADGSVVATTALRQTSCPFSGACRPERDDQYPSDCKLRPWERFTRSQPGEKVCWYAAGVKALRNTNLGSKTSASSDR